jgi:DegV family protein with EDD domain
MSVKIIIDSASDIPASYAEAHGMGFAPLKTTLGGKEYRDGIDIFPDEFFAKLEENKELAHTSQVNAEEFRALFEQAVSAGDDVVAITISSGLSGTYQSALIAASEFPGRVFVVDSLSATAGIQVLIQRALQLKEIGKTAKEIFYVLEELKKRVRLFVRLDTLEYLKRGGRISKSSAFVGGILNIKPILTLNREGKLETVGKARGIKQSHQMMNESIAACGGIDFSMPVVMTYAGDPDDGFVQNYLNDSTDVVGEHADLVTVGRLGCVIGTHSGPGAIVISFAAKEK